ncbi:MAG: hypothetical protein ACTSUB_08260, partial [Candidatus Thorarchaeota archaeon]
LEKIKINVDGHNEGFYDYELLVSDITWVQNTTDSVGVTVLDIPAPIVDSPVDIECYENHNDNCNITWNVYDDNPQSYSIFKDGHELANEEWNIGDWTIVFDLGWYEIGTYNFTISLHDGTGYIVTDSVNVTVLEDTQVPIISSPDDIVFNEGETGYNITWLAEDNNPLYYVIYENSSMVEVGGFHSTSELIFYSLDGLSDGTYNFSLIVSDSVFNTTDWVIVTVLDIPAPIVDSPPDIEYCTPSNTEYNITWNVYDDNPQTYSIFKDGLEVVNEEWGIGDWTIVYDLGAYEPGVYNFTISLHDASGYITTDSVNVTIVDDTEVPIVSSPDDIVFNEGDTGYNITWTAYDNNPLYYVIYRDDSMVTTGLWNSSSEIFVYVLDGLPAGVFNFSIIVSDLVFNSTDCVIVTVIPGEDTTFPTIDEPDDIVYVEGETGNIIIWTPYDLHPNWYEIRLNGTLVQWGHWNSSSETISINVDGHDIGFYVYELLVCDITWVQNTTDIVEVVVLPNTESIDVDSPPDIEYITGNTGNEIYWIILQGQTTNAVIFRNGTTIAQIPGAFKNYTVNVDYLTPGTYNFSIVVWGEHGDMDYDMVWVIILSEGTSTYTNTTTTNSTTGQIEYSNITIIITIGSVVVIIVVSGLICKGKRGNKWMNQYG